VIYLKRFLQYDAILESLLLEKVLYFGEKMRDVLKNMKHPYAKYMVNMDHGDNLEDTDNSYIEYSPKLGMVSWLPANREIDFQTKQELPETEKWATKKRQDVSIGKIVSAILKKSPYVNISESESELEKFINEYKAIQNTGSFKLVKGYDVKKYYFEGNYDHESDESSHSSLFNSCMRYDSCQEYFSVYIKNPNVSLCILLTDDDKIQGRAIVWYNSTIDGKPEVYMDRIYAVSDSITDKFKSYAHSNGWYCKTKQGSEYYVVSNGKLVIEHPNIKVILPDGDWETWEKPYMDSLRYFSYDVIDGKYIPVLFNYFMQNASNWKQKWDETNGFFISNRYYVDTLKEVRDLSSNTGLDFNNLLLANPTKINGNPEIWKVDDKNVLVMNYYSTIISSVIRNESEEDIMKLKPFISNYETHELVRKIGSKVLCEEYRSDIMMDMLENTNVYIKGIDSSEIRNFIQKILGVQIMSKEINENFSKVREFIIVLRPITFGIILNDNFELNINIDGDINALENEYYTKLKDDEKSKRYLISIIENEYNIGGESAVIKMCKEYIRTVVLQDKDVIEMYNEYIANSRQVKMNFIGKYFNEFVQSVNTTYLLNIIKENTEKIREFAIKNILTNNPSFAINEILESNTEFGKNTRISYVQKWLRLNFPNVEVKAEIRGDKFCYIVDKFP